MRQLSRATLVFCQIKNVPVSQSFQSHCALHEYFELHVVPAQTCGPAGCATTSLAYI